MQKTVLIFFILSLPVISTADPGIKYSYDEVASDIFWNSLYGDGGWTLYCGYQFHKPNVSVDGKALTIEHIYPTGKMFKALNCNSRNQCYVSKNRLFAEMEADMHNLYPIMLDLSNAFYDSEYGEIEGENWRIDGCDYERKNGIVEPRPLARGNIARAMFYMHTTYNLPIEKETLEVLKKWNHDDPPSHQEKIRNSKIELIQGNRNPYIDKPELADKLK